MSENNFKKRETYSIYEDGGRTFVINSYDPMLGNYIMFQCLTLVLPLGIGEALSKKIGIEVGKDKKPMSKNEFMMFQKDVLSTIEEKLESGERTPVVRDNGTYGIVGATSNLMFKLIVASLAFNFKDFFSDLQSIGREG